MNKIISLYSTVTEKEQIKKLPKNENTSEFIARYSAILLKRYSDIEKANNEAELRTNKLRKEYGLQ